MLEKSWLQEANIQHLYALRSESLEEEENVQNLLI